MGRSAVDVTRNLFGALMAADFGRALEQREIVSYCAFSLTWALAVKFDSGMRVGVEISL